ncbi:MULTISPECIES: branched-chain amino acid ABC transporter substrate-binding protein [Rhodomicrobium]|uniref:branched-chain amino acid ABC transporter substrate-binding protein n=1 Tax=Rhodomicrobium TaxID=1068 RepID=UPI001482AB1E|nr:MULTISPECIES: branched-chain amino acid ABC transporter substrate-binding protein [Rhodomicrobium]
MKQRLALRSLAAGVFCLPLLAASAHAADPIKIGFIDPLSGPFATTGENGLAEFKFAAERLVNEKGGVLGGRNFEIVPFDNQVSPKETLIKLQAAIDEGVRFVVQGNSSGVANALTDAVKKHNERNPDKRVIYLNYSAVDPALTNENCNFWHFRLDANADIKMDALTDVMAKNKAITKVYIVGQDYSFGKAVADGAVRDLAKKRPEIEIVGNELHPIGKVKDFTPYARKIIASGANAVITGNWGSDMVGLGKAIIDAGYKGPIYTYYAASNGITKTFGADGKNVIRVVSEGQGNPPPSKSGAEYITAFKAKNPNNDVVQPRVANTIQLLKSAIEKAGTTEAVAVAKAMEGLEIDGVLGGKVKMRADDHQAIQDIHIQVHTDEGITFPLDNSAYGLLVENTVTNAGADSLTTCKMERPAN